MSSSTTRICPNCGATNTGRSLYCAECGANLNEPADPNATRPFEPTANTSSGASQETEAYRPAWDKTWSGGTDSGDATGSTQSAGAVPPVPVTTGAPALIPTEPETGQRGFYLGLIAFLIIIAIAIALGVLTLL